jgi:hypothetical protein
VLWADLEPDDGMIFTKITLVITNCHGTEVARSKQGKSKQKDYKKAYQEAVRNALDGFQTSNLKMMPSEVKDIQLPKPVKVDTQAVPEIKEPSPKAITVQQPTIPKQLDSPSSMLKAFNFEAYTIIPNNPGAQILYQGTPIGILIPTAKPNLFLVRTTKFYGIARKTPTGYIIEREEEGANSLLTMKFE